METGHALRETSDALLRDLDVLVQIEEEKRTLEPGDDRLVDLAARVEEIAKRVLAATVRQHQLTQTANAEVEAGAVNAPEAPINDTPTRSIPGVLALWREAERRLSAAESGSADASEAAALVRSLREEYRHAHEATSRDR